MEEVVVSAPRIKPGVIVISDTINMMNLFIQMAQDGSGSGGGNFCGNVYMDVPDGIYAEACKNHDKNSSEDSDMSRLEADLAFLAEMMLADAKNGKSGSGLPLLYFLGVRLGGWTTYEGGKQ
jgi:hypothetical protein